LFEELHGVQGVFSEPLVTGWVLEIKPTSLMIDDPPEMITNPEVQLTKIAATITQIFRRF
jgi:hypothetical protein